MIAKSIGASLLLIFSAYAQNSDALPCMYNDEKALPWVCGDATSYDATHITASGLAKTANLPTQAVERLASANARVNLGKKTRITVDTQLDTFDTAQEHLSFEKSRQTSYVDQAHYEVLETWTTRDKSELHVLIGVPKIMSNEKKGTGNFTKKHP